MTDTTKNAIKVGDRVRVTRQDGTNLRVGTVGTVREVLPPTREEVPVVYAWVEVEFSAAWVPLHCLEAVK